MLKPGKTWQQVPGFVPRPGTPNNEATLVSTLVSKVLDQPETQMIIKEAAPLHENLWQYLTNDW